MQMGSGFADSGLGLQLRALLAQGRGANAAIADFLLRNPVRATACGIEELSAYCQTSPATLSRFARVLGFAGFAALRVAIADILQNAMQPVFHPVNKLRSALERSDLKGSGGNPVIAESLDASLDNLRATAAGLDLSRLNARPERFWTPRRFTPWVLGSVPTWLPCWRWNFSHSAGKPSMWSSSAAQK